MAGIGLTDALRGYQQGAAWRLQQEEIARQRQMRDQVEAANKMGLSVLDEDKAQWAASGAPGQYKPSETTMFRAAERRGMALAQSGLWDQYMANQAQIAPMRLQARAAAIQDYDSSGDADSFIRAIYPTFSGGKRIVGSETVQGADAVEGLAAIPTKTTFKFDDGSTQSFTNEEVRKLYGRMKASLVDPATSAKNEALIEMERAKAQIAANKELAVEGVKQEGRLKLEGVKHDYSIAAESAKQQGRVDLAEINNASADRRNAATNASADRRAAGNNAATLDAARIRAQQGGASGAGKRDQVLDQLHDELIRGFGKEQPGSLSGAKVGDELTLRAANYARDLVEQEGLSINEALRRAGTELKKRRAAAGG